MDKWTCRQIRKVIDGNVGTLFRQSGSIDRDHCFPVLFLAVIRSNQTARAADAICTDICRTRANLQFEIQLALADVVTIPSKNLGQQTRHSNIAATAAGYSYSIQVT